MRKPHGKKHAECDHECFCVVGRDGFYTPCFACQACEEKQREEKEQARDNERHVKRQKRRDET